MKLLKKGNHYCSPFFIPKILLSNNIELSFLISFDKSCEYYFNDDDQYDINKLFGISYGLHHTNSDRIGWRCVNRRIELLTYSYEDGIRVKSEHLCYVDFGQQCNMSIKVKISNNTRVVTFKVNNNIIKKSYKVKNSLIKYTLGLYFGGNKPAPHDMKIDIK